MDSVNFIILVVLIVFLITFTIITFATQKEYFARGFVCSYEFFKDSNTFTSYNYEPTPYCSAFSDAFDRGMLERLGVFE